MSSSDSEDDCYGDVVKTLHSLKNNFQEDKLESAKLLDTSTDTQDNGKKTSQNTAQSTELDNTLTDDEEIDKIIALNHTRTTRATRRSKIKEDTSCLANTVETPTRGRGRGRKRNRESLDTTTSNSCATTSNSCAAKSNICATTSNSCAATSNICATTINSCATTSNACLTTINTRSAPPVNPWTLSARGRNARRRGARNRRSGRISILDAFLQTFPIGNCEEYDDLSNNVQLFSKNSTTNSAAEVHVVEDDIFDENEELSVKVIWQSVDIVKFKIRKYQKISQIFEYFSDKTKSGVDKLLFTYNDKILKPDDTPDSINYSIAKFIDGGIVSNTVPLLTSPNKDSKPPDGIKVKFQYPNSKKAFEIYVLEGEPLSVSMMKCAEHMEVPIKRLKFEFDGDCITGQMTAKDLDMEGGECIDVKIIS